MTDWIDARWQGNQGTYPVRIRVRDEAGRRVFYKCPRCKQTTVRDYGAFDRDDSNGWIRALWGTLTAGILAYQPPSIDCPCGRKEVYGQTLQARYNDAIPCNARCIGATGPSCECSCGGANHGGKHVSA